MDIGSQLSVWENLCLIASHMIHAGAAVRSWSSLNSRVQSLLPIPASYIWDSNPHYRRIRSLVSMVKDSKHRIEIISDVLASYIQRGTIPSP